jgi:hypothetical protein
MNIELTYINNTDRPDCYRVSGLDYEIVKDSEGKDKCNLYFDTKFINLLANDFIFQAGFQDGKRYKEVLNIKPEDIKF